MGEERLLQELHQVATGLFAGRDCCPNAFAPLAAFFATCALRDFSVENDKSNCLFCNVVRRIDVWCRSELDVPFTETVHGNSAERGDEPQNIEQGTPNVEGKNEIPVKWEPQHGIDESG